MIKREARDSVKVLSVLRKHYIRENKHRWYAFWINKRLEDGSVLEYFSFIEEMPAALRELGEGISDRLLFVVTLNGTSTEIQEFSIQRNPLCDYCGLKTDLSSHEDCLQGNSDRERVMDAHRNSTIKQNMGIKLGQFSSKCYNGGEYKRINKLQNLKNVVNFTIQKFTMLVNAKESNNSN